MEPEVNSCGRRPFTINLKEKVMDKFKLHCTKEGYLVARRLEILMTKDMGRD